MSLISQPYLPFLLQSDAHPRILLHPHALVGSQKLDFLDHDLSDGRVAGGESFKTFPSRIEHPDGRLFSRRSSGSSLNPSHFDISSCLSGS